MARYYEETALIEFVKKYTPTINGETTMECVERAIREAPTADVVPKSEYDAVASNGVLQLHDYYFEWQGAKREIENLKVLLEMKDVAYEALRELYDTDTAALVKAREKTEVEVAREILGEVESLFYKTDFLDELGYIEFEIALAELKKKYTKGEPNGQNIKE